ncbi:hypothetical protein AVEN_177700-1 [Araneus ventricosus]|uniref:Uncharacterized protein n=1 Tax=Araneus ventricosus TaxID=182803 RepID=A0A4Y2QRZ7_ARAVE|nr:hypothetical protein AVEN_177700-1 [Araneus ventricosus]
MEHPILEYGGSYIFKPTSSKALDRSKWRCKRCLLLLATETSGLDTLRFFSMGYVKDRVYVPSMPKTIEEVKVRICNALASVTELLGINLASFYRQHQLNYNFRILLALVGQDCDRR